MPRFLSVALATILALPVLYADERIDALTQDSLQEAFRVLQSNYIRQRGPLLRGTQQGRLSTDCCENST